jgi:glyoxylase-like metal-dependent hydrolase (beta-lactamase superfamily II)
MKERIVIDERVSYWKASEQPLSADVGVVRGDRYWWLYDVGDDAALARCIEALPGEKRIVLSHFHGDHTGNLGRLRYDALYVGKNTARYLDTACVIVDRELVLADGVQLRIFPLPSSHAKGSVGLEVGGRYAFLGDGTYSTHKKGQEVYNAGLLKEEIGVLRALQADWLLLSHGTPLLRPRDEVLAELEAIYQKRNVRESYIIL